MTLAISPPGLQKPAPWGIVPGLVDPKYQRLWESLCVALPFWEGGGAPFDVAGRDAPSTFVGAPYWDISDRGPTLSFDGVDDAIVHPSYAPSERPSSAVTIAVFFKWRGGGQNYGGLAGTIMNGGGNHSYFLPRNGSGAAVRWYISTTSTTDSLKISSTGMLTNEWQWVVGRWKDGSTQDILFYDGFGNLRAEEAGPSPTGTILYNGATTFRVAQERTTANLDIDVGAIYVSTRKLNNAELDLLVRNPSGPFRMAGVPAWKAPAAGGDVFGVLALSAAGTLGLAGLRDRAGVLALNGAGTVSLAAAKEAAGVLALTASGTLTVVPIAELAGVLAFNGIATLSASPFVAVIEPPHVSDLLDLQTVLGPKITVITVASELTDVQTVISEELEASP